MPIIMHLKSDANIMFIIFPRIIGPWHGVHVKRDQRDTPIYTKHKLYDHDPILP